MANVPNPTTFTITDAKASAEKVTAFRVLLSQTQGGPYTLSSTDDALSSLTQGTDASGNATYTGTIASLNLGLAAGTWFAVAQAKNSGGYSANSPEVAFDIVPPPPSPPTGFAIA